MERTVQISGGRQSGKTMLLLSAMKCLTDVDRPVLLVVPSERDVEHMQHLANIKGVTGLRVVVAKSARRLENELPQFARDGKSGTIVVDGWYRLTLEVMARIRAEVERRKDLYLIYTSDEGWS